MRLIDADKLSSEMEFVFENARGITALAARLVWAFIEKADTVDNVAQKKGHWIISYIDRFTLSPESPNYLLARQSNGVLYIPEYRCSCCEQTMSSYPRGYIPNMPQDADFPNFCPNCGADMREQKT